MRKLFIGSDHAGLRLKDLLKQYIATQYKNVEVEDVGTHENSSCHYPDFAEKIALVIGESDRAVLVCGSGIGIGISMVKSGVSCCTVWNQHMAEQCGKQCQAMSIGERVIAPEIAKKMVSAFLKTWVKVI